MEILSNDLITRPIGLESGVIYNLLVRAGLREGVVRLTTQHSWSREGDANYTSGFRRSRGKAADRLPWWGMSAAVFGVSVPKADGLPLCPIEFLLWLFAAGTAPVGGQVFEGHAIVLSRVIDVATDGADVFAAGFFIFENNFGPDGGNGGVEVHHPLGLQILVTLRGVGAHIDGRVVADEFTHPVQRLAGCGQVVIEHRQFVLIQGLVNVCDVGLEQ